MVAFGTLLEKSHNKKAKKHKAGLTGKGRLPGKNTGVCRSRPAGKAKQK
jgi:hypothetical protein